MPRPPKNPQEFDQVNYVIDAWSRPCQAPWYIYIETLKPALLEAFITLITFGWDDVARGYARPRDLRRRTGKGKGKRRGLVPRRFPELGDLTGRHLPGSAAVKGIKWADLAKTIWRIDGMVQLGLFALLIVDVADDFAFNWTSVLYETTWCRESAKGRFSWHRTSPTFIGGPVWQTIGIDIEDYDKPMPTWVVTFGVTGVNGATIGFGVDLGPTLVDPFPTSYQARLINIDTGEVLNIGEVTKATPDGKGIKVLSTNVGASVRFAVQIKHDSLHAVVRDAFVTGMENSILEAI